MSRPPAHPRAFTLIELVLVVAIVAVFAAIALPRFGNADQAFKTELAARKLIADLEWARMAARARSASVTVTFNTTNDSYTLSGAVSDATLGTVPDLTQNLSQPPFVVDLSAVSLTLAGTTTATTSITFNAKGVPSAEGTITVRTRAAVRTVTLTAPGGAITLQ